MKYLCNFVIGPILIILIIFNHISDVISSWDFAVTTKGKIIFHGANWSQITSAAHQYSDLSAITFDETTEMLYFSDHTANSTTSIYSLQLSDHDESNHQIVKMVPRKADGVVRGLAFDPLDRYLYWTDQSNHHIYRLAVDRSDALTPPELFIDVGASKTPLAIAIDVCRRQLYWTNSDNMNPTIERIDLNYDDKNRSSQVLIKTNLNIPTGITVDQYTKRIYWVDDLMGDRYSVVSATLNGADSKILVEDFYNIPSGISVNEDYIYWTDLQQNAVFKVSKDDGDGHPIEVQKFQPSDVPQSIVARTHFLSSQANNPDCKAVIDTIKKTLLSSATSNDKIILITTERPNQFCLNNGDLNPKTGKCICPQEYHGTHCEIALCHNFCMQGKCYVSLTGTPYCVCNPGWNGERCERDLCAGYCLNGGHCTLEHGQPICRCSGSYNGRHCETININEICRNYCSTGIDDTDYDLNELCENCNSTAQQFKDLSKITLPIDVQYTPCGNTLAAVNNSLNKTIILASSGVAIALLLVVFIILLVRKTYRPLRPKIRKTYSVNRPTNGTCTTPLTCRPATQQCEITIEDCCNMTICDTPCFDPKSLQQERDCNKKEDKKGLLNNMNDDMY